MAKKKKMGFDTAKIKEYLIAKGERVGLVAAAALMFLLVLSGLWMGIGVESKHKQIISQAQALRSRVSETAASTDPKKDKKELIDGAWGEISPGAYAAGGWFDSGSIEDDKVNNPFVLPLVGSKEKGREKEKYMQIDVIRSPVFVNELTAQGKSVKTLEPVASNSGAGTTQPTTYPSQSGVQLAREVQPERLVVVSALFPFKRQLEVFQQALRKNTIQEVAGNPEIAPKFLGINVIRAEVENGRIVDWEKLFYADPKKKLEVLDEWKNFLKLAVFDEKSYRQVKKYVRPGLATPLPKLAYGTYPELDLPSIEVSDAKTSLDGFTDPNAPPGMEEMPPEMMEAQVTQPSFPGVDLPMAGMDGATTGAKFEQSNMDLVTLAKKDKHTAKKLIGDFNIFHPMGQSEDEKKKTGLYPSYGPPSSAEEPPDFMPNPDDPLSSEFPAEGIDEPGYGTSYQIPEHLLLRFVDVTVKPGKTYKYYIQVRLKNPNHKKKDIVAYPAQAEVKELLSPWTETPPVSLEDEYDYYVVDQHLISPKSILHITKDTATEEVRFKSPRELKYKTDAIAVQVHRWAETAKDPDSNTSERIGDWAIAERLLVKRGQRIGDRTIEVPMPVWDDKKAKFELLPPAKEKKELRVPPEYKRQKYAIPLQTGVEVDFKPKGPAPLVVDFTGGALKFQTGSYTKAENSAVKMLVVSPDGKLLSFNSRDDTDPRTARGSVRTARYEYWRTLIDALTPKTTTNIPGATGEEGGLGILDSCGGEYEE